MSETLEQLALEAERIGAPNDQNAQGTPEGGEQASQTPPPITNTQAIFGAVAAGREMFCYYTKLETPRRVLTDQRVGELAGVWAPVCDKYGLDLGAIIGDYVLEFTAMMLTFGILQELRQVVGAEMAQRKAEEAAKKKETTPDSKDAASGE